ncbi:MAG: restriction endonuclease [Sulfuritalea sp.]|nr:restriction endonuclease [Sulfuritalea sp.]
MDITFHYPPELLQLLVDAIPKLCKSKQDLLLFFQGAGIAKPTLQPYTDLLRSNKVAFNKYHVTRDVVAKINEQGEAGLRVRRELLKRVTEFEDFSVCWDNDRAAARGLVAQIRDLVNVKDSFTRMRIEKDEEKRKHQEERESAARQLAERRARQDKIKADLFSLFGETDAHNRGKALEGVLNDLFNFYGISVREAFTIKGKCGEGVIEQIDGLIELDGHLYLVEMKWWNTSIGVAEVAPHLVRVFNRGGQVRGIFISYSNFTEPAITQCRDALARGTVIVMATLQELVEIVDSDRELRRWLTAKTHAAIVDKEPYFKQ